MQEIINKVIHDLGWSNSTVLKSKHGSCAELNALEFVSAILNTNSVPEASLVLNVGQQTLNRLINRHLVPVFGQLNGGNETWKYVLLRNASIKKCYSCQIYLAHDNFGQNISSPDGLDGRCDDCKSIHNAEHYDKYKDTYHKPYIQSHRSEYNARHAKRRAQKLNATPSWVNLNKIKDFYLKCPEGCHVDHIIPLQGETVCGLHVENNLQYLSAEDNMKKGNKFTGDWGNW